MLGGGRWVPTTWQWDGERQKPRLAGSPQPSVPACSPKDRQTFPKWQHMDIEYPVVWALRELGHSQGVQTRCWGTGTWSDADSQGGQGRRESSGRVRRNRAVGTRCVPSHAPGCKLRPGIWQQAFCRVPRALRLVL